RSYQERIGQLFRQSHLAIGSPHLPADPLPWHDGSARRRKEQPPFRSVRLTALHVLIVLAHALNSLSCTVPSEWKRTATGFGLSRRTTLAMRARSDYNVIPSRQLRDPLFSRGNQRRRIVSPAFPTGVDR